jgi:PBP1b-binding outer membrane lipoprotein LpoB
MIDSYIDEPSFNKNKWVIQLENLFNKLNELDENNFEEIINKIFLLKKEKKEIKINSKQNSYYAIN